MIMIMIMMLMTTPTVGLCVWTLLVDTSPPRTISGWTTRQIPMFGSLFQVCDDRVASHLRPCFSSIYPRRRVLSTDVGQCHVAFASRRRHFVFSFLPFLGPPESDDRWFPKLPLPRDHCGVRNCPPVASSEGGLSLPRRWTALRAYPSPRT